MTSIAASNATWFGHPRGLLTLFFTEMWERFSYYGMRALLILFMTTAAVDGGLAFDVPTSAAIYGIYSAAVYLVCLPGGWIADRLLGQQDSIWYGGIIIALGHGTMALPATGLVSDITGFFFGLTFIVLGTGLLKPNISAIVGELYPEGGGRRDAGFTIYYMGINLGAFLGPILCGYFGEKVDWHLGFGLAGIGMLGGLIQYRMTRHHLLDYGIEPSQAPKSATKKKLLWAGVAALAAFLFVIVQLGLSGSLALPAVKIAHWTKISISVIAGVFFIWVLAVGGLNSDQKKRVVVIAALFVGAALFWSGFEQAGSSLNLFAENHTNRMILGWEIPTTWFQSLNPFFILLAGPFFAWLWVRLAARNLEPAAPFKFALGLIQLAAGFLVMVVAAKLVAEGQQVLPYWLILTYFLHTTGELCLSPVGLSTVTKLAPRKYYSQMMGTWFMGAALGNVMAGLIAGDFDEHNVAQMPDLFMSIVLTSAGAAIVFAVFALPLKKWMRGVR